MKINRTQTLRLRVTAGERAVIEENAHRAGLDLSKFLRQRAMEREFPAAEARPIAVQPPGLPERNARKLATLEARRKMQRERRQG